MRTAWELPLRKSRVVVMANRNVLVHPMRRDRVGSCRFDRGVVFEGVGRIDRAMADRDGAIEHLADHAQGSLGGFVGAPTPWTPPQFFACLGFAGTPWDAQTAENPLQGSGSRESVGRHGNPWESPF